MRSSLKSFRGHCIPRRQNISASLLKVRRSSEKPCVSNSTRSFVLFQPFLKTSASLEKTGCCYQHFIRIIRGIYYYFCFSVFLHRCFKALFFPKDSGLTVKTASILELRETSILVFAYSSELSLATSSTNEANSLVYSSILVGISSLFIFSKVTW